MPFRKDVSGMPYIEDLNKVYTLLGVDNCMLYSDNLADSIQELCVAKLCAVLGIKCAYNFKNEFFLFFSCIAGEVIANRLNIKISIAPSCLRCFKFENVNLMDKAYELYDRLEIDEFFIDLFNLADRFKYVINVIKKV